MKVAPGYMLLSLLTLSTLLTWFTQWGYQYVSIEKEK